MNKLMARLSIEDNGSRCLGKDVRILLFIVVAYFVLLLGRGSTLLSSIDPRSNAPGLILFLLMNIPLVVLCPRPLFTKKFLLFSAVLVAWVGVHFIIDTDFQYFTYFQFVVYSVSGYLLVRVIGYRLVLYFEKAVFWLAVVSLVFWCIELIAGAHEFGKLVFLPQTYGKDGGSFLIYTVLDYDYEGNYFMGLVRNCGFAWEPGRFASILIIGLFFNRLLHPSQLLNAKSIVMLLALFSTFSTTGYIAVIVLWGVDLFFVRKTSYSFKIVAAVIGVIIVIGGASLSFIYPKISQLLDTESFVSENLSMYSDDEIWTVDRFEGIVLDGLNFIHDPLFGYGLAQQDQYIYESISPILNTSNGITKPLAQYGLPLGFLFFLFFIKGTKQICRRFRFRCPWLLFLLMMVISVSYSFETDPIIRALTLFTVFSSTTQRRTKVKVAHE